MSLTGRHQRRPGAKVEVYRLRRRDIALVSIIAVGQAVTLVAFLLLLVAVVEQIELGPPTAGDSASWQPVWRLGVGMVIAALAHAWLRGVEFSVCEKIGYEVVRGLRMRMYARLTSLTPRDVQGRSRGGLLLRFIGDLSMLRTWISRGLLGGMASAIVLSISMIALLVLNTWIAVAFFTVVIAGSAASLSSGDHVRRATRTMRRRRSLVASNVAEQLNALAVVRVSGRSAGEAARLSRQNDSMTRALFRVADLRGRLRAISAATGMLAIVAVVLVGNVEVYKGSTTVSVVLATVVISRQLSAPVRVLGLAHDYWQRSRVSVAKIEGFLAGETLGEKTDLPRLRVRRGALLITGLTIPGALDDVTVSVPGGRLVAVTGRSGSGKSTLLQAIARLTEGERGHISIDGQDVNEVALASVHNSVGMVGPDLPLMRGSVRRNLTYRCPGASEEEIQRVILDTGLDEVLDQFEGGLNAWIVEGGANLSLGQRQRLALARALVGNPSLLLLDEPTTGLDAQAAEAFRRALAHHQGTVLLVTHDPAEIAMADMVLVLDNGRLVDVKQGHDARRQHYAAGREPR